LPFGEDHETKTIQAADPIGSGFVKSISRPSTNSSGFTNYELIQARP
jgi:hypothetical protein